MNALKNIEQFNGREHILEILRKSTENFKSGHSNNLILVGPKNIGKSSILKKFMSMHSDINSFYFDFEKIALTPEEFALEMTKGNTKSKRLGDIKGLIANELEKIKPNQEKLIRWGLSFFDVFSSEKGKSVVIFDGLDKILALNNFSQIKNIIQIFEEEIAQWKNTMCLGSSESNLDFKWSKETISGLDRQSAKELCKLTEKEVDFLYALTRGTPLHLNAVCKRYKETKNIEKAFVIETLSKQGIVYNALKLSLQESLARARGQTLLFAVLKVLAKQGGLRLTDIAAKIYRSGPVTKSIVDRLVDVNLIVKNGKLFSFNDVLMKYFVLNIFVLDNELDFDYDKSIVNKLAKEVRA